MTPDEINAAIAESVGWRIDDELEDGALMGTHPSTGWDMVPDFHGSLDAIVPVVRAMDDDSRSQVVCWLFRLSVQGPLFSSHFATPSQWCEAYLKAKGLWK